MQLFLVQHGLAYSKEQNSQRPLTPSGREQVLAVIKLAWEWYAPTPVKVYHSGKLRAQQTAELIADVIKPKPQLVVFEELSPEASVNSAYELILQAVQKDEDIMLVGHLPHLERLAAFLLTKDYDKSPLIFKNGGIVCMTNDDGGTFRLKWVIIPREKE